MERIHADLPDTEFKMPSTVEEASICTSTGLLATSSCNAVTEYFDTEQIPTQYCSGHYTYSYSYDYSSSYSEDSSDEGSSEDSETTVEEPTPETPAEVPEETQPEVTPPAEETTETPPADTGGGEVIQ